MKSRNVICFVLAGLFLALTFTLSARAGGDRDHDRNHDRDDQGFGRNSPKPLKLLGTILIPGSPIASTDIAFVDQNAETFFFADRSNSGVDLLDAENDVYLGRVTSQAPGCVLYPSNTPCVKATFAGNVASQRGGPNGVLSTPDKRIWAGDGDTTVKVADGDPNSPSYLQIIAMIDVHSTIMGNTCTGGAAGTCKRADEMAYDPADNIVVAATDSPTSVPPYLTFIDASFPYTILGQLNFAAQGEGTGSGLEQPVWDSGLHSILQTLPANNVDGTGSIVIIDPKKEKVTRTISLDPYHCSPSGMALGPSQHVIVACKIPGAAAPAPSTFPLVIDLNTGNEVGPGIDQVGGGDEVNYNPGDNRFVVSSTLEGVSTYPGVLGVINADSGDWLQNLPPATAGSPGTGGLKTVGGSGNLAAFGENNHVFVIVKPTATVTDICPQVTVSGVATDYGCVAVFGPTKEDPDSFPF